MRAVIEMHQGRGLINWILNDRARALFGHTLVYLHATTRPDDPRSGLSAVRVREFAVETGLCSSGRAAAMLALMRGAGYLAPAPGTADRRFRRLEPTEKLLAIQRTRLRRQFEAMAIFMPQARAVLPLFGRTDFELALARTLGLQFTAGTRMLSHAPDLAPFTERSAGMVVLFSLMLATEANGAFVPDTSVSTSISGLSANFRVSRAQVRRVFREAEELGLLTRRGGDNYENVVVTAKLRQNIFNMFAFVYCWLANAAAAARSEIGSDEPLKSLA